MSKKVLSTLVLGMLSCLLLIALINSRFTNYYFYPPSPPEILINAVGDENILVFDPNNIYGQDINYFLDNNRSCFGSRGLSFFLTALLNTDNIYYSGLTKCALCKLKKQPKNTNYYKSFSENLISTNTDLNLLKQQIEKLSNENNVDSALLVNFYKGDKKYKYISIQINSESNKDRFKFVEKILNLDNSEVFTQEIESENENNQGFIIIPTLVIFWSMLFLFLFKTHQFINFSLLNKWPTPRNEQIINTTNKA